MKKIILAVFVLTLMVNVTAVGQIEINAYTGWVPASNTAYNYNGYRIRIDGSQNYGAGIGLTTPVGLVEFNYMGYSSSMRQDGGIVDVVQPQPININYYQIGILKTLLEHEKLVPYGMFSLGASSFNPTEDPLNAWRFTISLGLGMRYFFTPVIGIRLQARMLMPLYFGGVGFGCGVGTNGSSCGGSTYFGVEILQGDFTAGIVLKINTD